MIDLRVLFFFVKINLNRVIGRMNPALRLRQMQEIDQQKFDDSKRYLVKLSWSRGAAMFIDRPALQGNFTGYRIARPT